MAAENVVGIGSNLEEAVVELNSLLYMRDELKLNSSGEPQPPLGTCYSVGIRTLDGEYHYSELTGSYEVSYHRARSAAGLPSKVDQVVVIAKLPEEKRWVPKIRIPDSATLRKLDD